MAVTHAVSDKSYVRGLLVCRLWPTYCSSISLNQTIEMIWVLVLGCVFVELWSSVTQYLCVSLQEGCHPRRYPIVATSLTAAVMVNKPQALWFFAVIAARHWEYKIQMTLKCFPLQLEPSSHYSQSQSWHCSRCRSVVVCYALLRCSLIFLLHLPPLLLCAPSPPLA